jgi:hypothetical protein
MLRPSLTVNAVRAPFRGRARDVTVSARWKYGSSDYVREETDAAKLAKEEREKRAAELGQKTRATQATGTPGTGRTNVPGAGTDEGFIFRVNELTAFINSHGRYPTPDGSGSEGPLANWIGANRSMYRAGNKRLTPDKVAALEGLPGWYWSLAPGEQPPALNVRPSSPPPEIKGSPSEMIDAAAKTVAKKSGHDVKDALPRKGNQLNCRKVMDATGHIVQVCEIVPDQEIPAHVNSGRHILTGDALFDQRTAELLAFVNANDRHPDPEVGGAEAQLALWCTIQRNAGKRNNLPGLKREALEAVPGWIRAADQVKRSGPQTAGDFLQNRGVQPGAK